VGICITLGENVAQTDLYILWCHRDTSSQIFPEVSRLSEVAIPHEMSDYYKCWVNWNGPTKMSIRETESTSFHVIRLERDYFEVVGTCYVDKMMRGRYRTSQVGRVR
jgi:hypothetical protein